MYFLIGVWGHERRLYAAYKFSSTRWLGRCSCWLRFYAGDGAPATDRIYTFDLLSLYSTQIPPTHELWYFAAFALAFAIKVPMWPLHTWLPDAHVEAPTAGSVILAAVLLKMGSYGFLRFAIPLFPNGMQAMLPLLLALPVIGIVYGALVAMVQPDLKKLVAYSSVSHLDRDAGLFCFTPKVSRVLSTNAQPWCLHWSTLPSRRDVVRARAILEPSPSSRDRAQHADLCHHLRDRHPVIDRLPGRTASWGSSSSSWAPSRRRACRDHRATGVVLGAVYMLCAAQRVLFGKLDKEANRDLPDLNGRELSILVPLVVLIVVMGVWPRPFLDRVHGAVGDLMAHVDQRVEPERRASATPPARSQFALKATANVEVSR